MNLADELYWQGDVDISTRSYCACIRNPIDDRVYTQITIAVNNSDGTARIGFAVVSRGVVLCWLDNEVGKRISFISKEQFVELHAQLRAEQKIPIPSP